MDFSKNTPFPKDPLSEPELETDVMGLDKTLEGPTQKPTTR